MDGHAHVIRGHVFCKYQWSDAKLSNIDFINELLSLILFLLKKIYMSELE